MLFGVIFLYYKGARYRNYINSEIRNWLKDGKLQPESGYGVRAFAAETNQGDDLRRGADNFQYYKEEQAESPVSNGLGGYVPNSNVPMPPEGEKSRLEPVSFDGAYSRDIRLMHELFGRINAFLYPIVVDVLNNREYSGSDLYDYDQPKRENSGGSVRDNEIDRENLNRMITEVYNKAVKMSDDYDEIMNDDNELLAGESREELLRAAIESLILTEIFLSRRPYYRNTAKAYRYFEGRYDGVNPIY